MKIKMLVSISSVGFSARQGEEIDVDAETASEFCASGWAQQLEPFEPKPAKPKTPPEVKNAKPNSK